MSAFLERYFSEIGEINQQLNLAAIESIAVLLAKTRDNGGRLFILGVGGSAGNASHAVNDFRKICAVEAYAPTDNVSELTARTNDEGWETTFAAWLRGSHVRSSDALLILSVGGGNVEMQISTNIVHAIDLAKTVGACVLGIVGRDGGYTAKSANACVIIPTGSADLVTPHAEAFQAVIWHALVMHPLLKQKETKWESMSVK